MLAVIIRRIFWSIPVFLLVTGITFVTMHVLPGGPFDTDKTPPALVAQMEAIYGLNRPVVEQYATWLGNVARLRFGPSLAYRGQSVESFLLPGFSISAQLGGMAMLFALLIGLPAGIIAALKHGHWQDRSATFVAILGVSVPPLVLGPLLYWIFALQLDWLPVAKWASLSEDGRWSYVSHASQPAATMAGGGAPIMARCSMSLTVTASPARVRVPA